MSNAKVEFRVNFHGDNNDIFEILRSADGPQEKGVVLGPLCQNFSSSRDEPDDEDSDMVRGSVPVADANVLAKVIGAVNEADLIRLEWSVEAIMSTADGIRAYVALHSHKWGSLGFAIGDVEANREKILGAFVAKVRSAKKSIEDALNGDNGDES